MKAFQLIPALALVHTAHAQKDTALTFSGYAEVYYSYDLAQPYDHMRQGPFYCFNRHNEVNLNLGYMKMAYAKDNVRGNLALMAGTYAQYNLSAEQEQLRNAYEANVGVRISKTKALWIDAGIMPSHIGFESAVGKDCWTLSRSLVAENSPYFEAGAKLGYTSDNGEWHAAALVLNGWQRIQRVPGNNDLNLGTQLLYKPNDNTTLNWSTFIGNDKPDTVAQMRVFNNFFAQLELGEHFGVIAGVDIGLEQAANGDSSSLWIGPVLIPRYQFDAKNTLAARVEYYQDPDGVIIPTVTPNGFKTLGYSINYDRAVTLNVWFRLEARTLKSADKIFRDADGRATTTNTFLTASLSIALP